MGDMKVNGRAVKVMFDFICAETYEKTKKWFQENPDEPYCYWSKDEFIHIRDKENQELLARHPEIEDINDHTIVEFHDGKVFMHSFCPKLRESLSAMYEGGISENVAYGIHWWIEPDPDRDGNWLAYSELAPEPEPGPEPEPELELA